MKHQMRIELNTAEGAMLRTVGLVERRGFQVRSCTLHDAVDDHRVLEVSVESDRSVEVLKRQLERLHDVRSVELTPLARQSLNKVGAGASMGVQ
jgi:acetolactate synthase regulatory subunit